ncbi:hypothetical protein Ancab_033999 [Ancistrocladus abbreviatus]
MCMIRLGREHTKALAKKRCIPVFLDEETVHQYYNGFCNNILWPLFHYLGLPYEDCLATTHGFQSQSAAYKMVNQMFADVVNKHYKDGDIVWTLPSHSELLRSVLAVDIIGLLIGSQKAPSGSHITLGRGDNNVKEVLVVVHLIVSWFIEWCAGVDMCPIYVVRCCLVRVKGRANYSMSKGGFLVLSIGKGANWFNQALELPLVQDYMKELKDRFARRKSQRTFGSKTLGDRSGNRHVYFQGMMEGDAFMEDATIVIKTSERQDLRDPPLALARPCSETKIPRVSTTSLGTLSPRPIFVLSHPVDKPGPCSEDAYGSSVAFSPRPISKPRSIADRVGLDFVDACSGGHSIDTQPPNGETNSAKKSEARKKNSRHKVAKSIRSSRKKSKHMSKLSQ